MSETERAIAKAKAEGRAEAVREAGKRLAAAEFRAACAGRMDAAAALEVIDLSKFVDDDGEPDTKAINNVVDRLSAMVPAKEPAKIPAGPREAPNGEPDFLRAQLNSSRR